MLMLKWDSISRVGRRASDRGQSAPAVLACDRTAGSGDRARADRGPVPAADRAAHRPHRRRRGARALGDGADRAEALFARAAAAGLAERLSRLVQRKALRSAAVWEGPLKGLELSINLLPQDISRAGYDQWLLDEIDAAGIDPARITVEITESALLVDQRRGRRAAGAAARRRACSIAVDDFGTGYASLAYLTTLAARHDQDRPRADRRHRRRRAATGSSSRR